MEAYTNHLISESSPYLLQHAHNPVDWYPWGEEALEKARSENKLVIVSIGYAACHWCHVMEHESFEDSTVAELMNKYYVSIKVDREERPDVDQVYMDAANIMTGRGGWPLNVITLPDGRPIFAGTYFPKDQWLKVLTGVQEFYEKTPEKAIEQAEKVQDGVSQLEIVTVARTSGFHRDSIESAYTDWLNSMDMKNGGRRANMKFPMPLSYLAMMNYAFLNQNDRGLEAVKLTMDRMAQGGIYDQLGGGFSRYSVDPQWHVPHFEKMLYDNGQLISLYAEAYKLTKDPLYKQIIDETIEFCNRELRSSEGAYFASLDADSDGEEGKYYVWTAQEVDDLLGSNSELFKDYYDIKKNGNWEHGKNVLQVKASIEEFSRKKKLPVKEVAQIIENGREILFNARQKRIRPALDDKTLTSWNGLMISGLAHAYEATGNEQYRNDALKAAEFIEETMWDDETLKRNYKNGKVTINGFIDDYAFTIRAAIDLYQITLDEKWLKFSNDLMDQAMKNFYSSDTGLFKFKSKQDTELYVAKSAVDDNVIPAGNSQMAINLYELGHFLYNEKYIKIAEEMMSTVAGRMLEQSAFYYNWFELYSLLLSSPYEIAIVGEDFDAKRKELVTNYIPNALILGGATEGNLELLQNKLVDGKTMIYVCVDKVCQLPVSEPSHALSQVN